MIDPQTLKPFLVHDDPDVRYAAVHPFYRAWSEDPELVPLTLEACERLGDAACLGLLARAHRFPLTEAALGGVLDRLAHTRSDDAAHHYNRILWCAPVPLAAAHEAAIAEAPNVLADTVERLARRRDLAAWSDDALWAELQDFSERSRDAHHVGDIDHGYADDLIEALGDRDAPAAEELCALVASTELEGQWLEYFVIDLAGARRLTAAVPALVDKFRIDADYLRERVQEALPRIGDAQAVRLTREMFPREEWHVRLYAVEIFGRIHHPESEAAALALLETEEDAGIRTSLCYQLCSLFSEPGVDVVRREIERGYDRMQVCLEDSLLAVAEILGLDLPEADAWRAARDEQHRRREDARANVAELARRANEAEARAASLREAEPLFPRPSAPEAFGPHGPIAAQPAIGRNDPCPCGSGKKFKKCCGRRKP